MEAGQKVTLNGKPATVISVGDGVVHLEQDGETVSVHPDAVNEAEAADQSAQPLAGADDAEETEGEEPKRGRRGGRSHSA